MMSSEKDSCSKSAGRFAAILSFVAFLMYAAAVASPRWIEQEFTSTIKVGVLPAIEVKVNSEIGLLWACTDRTFLVPTANLALAGMEQGKEKCESLADIDADMVEDWQWVAAGLGIGTLVFSFVTVIMACCLARRGARDAFPRAAIVILYLLACGLLVASLVLFSQNKEFPAGPTMKIDYDYHWGFYVAAISAASFFFLMAFNACAPFWVSSFNAVV